MASVVPLRSSRFPGKFQVPEVPEFQVEDPHGLLVFNLELWNLELSEKRNLVRN
jgi:hypothetical protein